MVLHVHKNQGNKLSKNSYTQEYTILLFMYFLTLLPLDCNLKLEKAGR